VGEQLGINRDTLRGWVKQAIGDIPRPRPKPTITARQRHCTAGVRTATARDARSVREPRNGYPSRCGSSSWTRSTAVRPFRAVLRDLGLTSNRVWGLAKTDQEWSAALEAALTGARRL
jgi:hypothetical protein